MPGAPGTSGRVRAAGGRRTVAGSPYGGCAGTGGKGEPVVTREPAVAASTRAHAAHEGAVQGSGVSGPGGGGRRGAPRRQAAREPAARTYARALPIVPVRARGLTIEGADGRRYLDCVSGAGALALGHNHPVVLDAIRTVLDSGAPLHVMDLTTPVEDAFVTELLRTLPPGLADRARVRFCGPAGADPVATAVALARAATGRARVVNVTDADEPALDEPALDDGEPGRERPAGLLLEPVRSDAGMRPVPDGLVRRLRARTADRSVPFIVDETGTGVGRTGAYWAFEHSGVTPDVLVLAKAIGGSLPLAVVVHREDLGEPDSRAGTFRGNQLALAAGAATLAHVREHRLADHAATLGGRMLTGLRALAAEFTCVGDVRGRGLMAGVELVAPDGAPDVAAHGARAGTAAALADAVRRECLRRGLIVDVTGPRANVVRLLPPLIVTEEQMSAVLDRLADAVRAVDRHRPGGPVPIRGERAPR
ncbi:aspartate aminotransferase family protein [Streptomyces sp. CB09001]|uniref:aminotransferase class III-fold pyridoxal phosphate-dependent enzyme n=1 Tax=Streptomyces sp. CB09001 TaxID=2083284 RepID=UPI000E20F424|nr:aminotransferase class III-fold pyridoxal phosphate-dependent enzyme [Streptomyces sp. CB09001]AXL91357.1 aspartate aminotransferase family protein [Streptomyces sp. CB09001]